MLNGVTITGKSHSMNIMGLCCCVGNGVDQFWSVVFKRQRCLPSDISLEDADRVLRRPYSCSIHIMFFMAMHLEV